MSRRWIGAEPQTWSSFGWPSTITATVSADELSPDGRQILSIYREIRPTLRAPLVDTTFVSFFSRFITFSAARACSSSVKRALKIPTSFSKYLGIIAAHPNSSFSTIFSSFSAFLITLRLPTCHHAWSPVRVFFCPHPQGEGGSVWYSFARGDCMWLP